MASRLVGWLVGTVRSKRMNVSCVRSKRMNVSCVRSKRMNISSEGSNHECAVCKK